MKKAKIIIPPERQEQWMDFLHSITILGYEENPMIKITLQFDQLLKLYFMEEKTPEQALIDFKKFLARWTALKGRFSKTMSKRNLQ